MSIVVFVSNTKGKINKAGLEAICYAADMAKTSGDSVTAITAGSVEGDGGAGAYGASKLLVGASVNHSDSTQVTNMVNAVISDEGASMIVTSHDNDGKQVAPRLAARLNCGIVTGVTGLPDTSAGFTVKKNVFSGKAIAQVSITSDKKILAILPNSHGLHEHGGSAEVTETQAEGHDLLSIEEITIASGKIALPEADVVVSAGRGLKGPEHWGMIEELAD